MRFTTTSVAAAGLGAASLVSAVPVLSRQSTSSACANITEGFQQAVASNATSYFIDGEVAYNCLNSMPFDSQRASEFVVELYKYMQYQSTSEVLKNPPKSYLSPAVDLLGGLNSIYDKANASQYQSQYQFDADINNLITSANDGHLSVRLCSLSIFTFNRPYTLLSVSQDGLQLPQLYVDADAQLLRNGSTAVSNVVQINGQNVTQYLEKVGLTLSSQDPDAQWNALFPSIARSISLSPLDGEGAFYLPGGAYPGSPAVSLTFANGSTVSSRVQASFNGANFNYTTGQALYSRACLPAVTNSTSSSSSSSTTSTTVPTSTSGPRGYPTPVIRDPYNKIAGYYLDGAQNDTAVLFVPSFDPTSEGELPDNNTAIFAEVASAFVNASLADGKTKMIVDVTGNPGGDITQGFNLFKLFFPDLEPYSATRMRDHESTRLTMKGLSGLNASDDPVDYASIPFYYGLQVTPDQNESISSWEELYGPENINGANMSTLYANFNYSIVSTVDDPLRGYGGVPLNVSGRPFKAENILVVSDGFCASTCTTFTTLMTNPDFGGAKSLAFGGRPMDGPMQIMGGVRGAQSMAWNSIYRFASLAYQTAYNQTNTTAQTLTTQELELFTEVGPIPLADFPLIISSGNLNLRNAYLPQESEIPLQFAYQAANCRLFYTYDNIAEPGTQWPAAAQAIWGNGTCVSGSQYNSTTYY